MTHLSRIYARFSWLAALLPALTASAFAAPVINEIHYHPGDSTDAGTSPVEFVEIHNPDVTAIDLSGWKLADAVTYTFPAGTTLAAGGYVVVSADPTTLTANTGVAAQGPWSGKLSNEGETLELRDAANVIQDTVSYKPGFPWPTAADGLGPSMELMNPALDNDLGGSWRSSGASITSTPAAYLTAAASGWKYFKGTSEASSPTTAWRATAFNDSAWLSGQAPIGYGGGVSCNTVLGDMNDSYTTVFGRKSFTLEAGTIPDTLTLGVQVDDGCIVWINGREVYRFNMGAGEQPHTFGTGANYVGTAVWKSVTLTGAASYLVAGTNVISIQAANVRAGGSSDFSFDLTLAPPAGNGNRPTPGASNSVRTNLATVPPAIRQVTHAPLQPTAGQAVTVTTRITDTDGMGAVSLLYQTVDPGSYIRVTDALYQTAWTTVAMRDDGTNGDLTANDGTYTAVIPASVQTHRRLVRYRVRAADTLGNTLTVPFADDEQPNFAYFAYNGVPSWTGAIRPTSFSGFAATPAVTYPSSLISGLPPYQLIANAADVTNSQYNSSYDGTKFYGTIVYDGVVYDHIQFRNRGIGSTYQSGKNKWNINFNRARDLVPRDNWGRKYAATWNNLILNANASPWAPVNRGSAGIEEASSARIYELAGNTNFRTHYVHWRVIDAAAESSASDQYGSDLWGLYLAIEPTEGNLLDERGLSDGNIYSIEGNGGDKKNQGDDQPLDNSDWNTFSNQLDNTGQTEAWYRANMDLDKLYTFLAINRLIGNVDVRPGDNYRYYHRSSDNKWEILAYDLDMMYIAAHHWGGTMDGVVVAGQPYSMLAVMRHPAIAREYRNRCREILDLMASDASATGGQIGQLLDEYGQMVNPTGQTVTWANLDAALWNLNTRTPGSGGNSGQGSHRGNFYRALYYDSRGGAGGTVATGSWTRTLADPDGDGFADFAARKQWFVDFTTNTYPASAAPWVRKATNTAGGGTDSDINRQKGYGYKYLEWESLYGGYADSRVEPTTAANTDFPATPVTTSTSAATFPNDALTFTSSAFSDPQGAGTFAAWQWRIAEIAAPQMNGAVPLAPGKYEIQALATSAELTTAPGAFTIPPGVPEAGKTYRVRTRQKDSTGNWSHWSAPVQFTATAPVVSLVHYWNFNNTETLLTPTQTTGGGSIQVTGASESSTGQDFNGENARNGDAAGSHLRMNNPLTSTLDLKLPTSGYQNLRIRYETRRSGQGAGQQSVSYSLDGNTFNAFTTFAIVDGIPEVKLLDFRGVAGANNNPTFAVRITFQQAAGGMAGNNRFDNLTVEGDALPPGYETWKTANFPNPADQANPSISGPNANPAGDGVVNLMRYALGVGPYESVTGLLPSLVNSAGSYKFRFRIDPEKTDLIWKVEASPDLQSWPQVLFNSATDPIPPAIDGWVTVPVPASSATFARLKVERK